MKSYTIFQWRVYDKFLDPSCAQYLNYINELCSNFPVKSIARCHTVITYQRYWGHCFLQRTYVVCVLRSK